MNKIYSIIRNEGICGFVKRVFVSVKRRISVRLYFRRYIDTDDKRLDSQRSAVFEKDVLFSIITPAYNVDREFFSEMVKSCVRQTYPKWELCIADAGDGNRSYIGEEVLKEINDERIRHIRLDRNEGISDNTNAALKIAKGDYMVLLDNDDMLHPSALFECMKALGKSRADVIYSDEAVFENKISNIKSLHIKPDFSPDSLRGNNYICHLSVFSREVLDKAGLFRKEFDGAQDHDMILRLAENAESIVHIPKVLYFWRSHGGSVAKGIAEKSYAADAGRRAVESHLDRIGRAAKVENNREFPTVYNISYEAPDDARVSILIWGAKKNGASYGDIKKLIADTDYGNFDVFAGGHMSAEDKELIRSGDKCSLVEEAKNISAFMNAACKMADGRFVVCVNGMARVKSKDWLKQLVTLARWKESGAVGPEILSYSGRISQCGAYIKDGGTGRLSYISKGLDPNNCGYMMSNAYAHNMDVPSTACFMVEKEKLAGTGGFAAGYDDEHCMAATCLRLKDGGYFNICNPLAAIVMGRN